MVTRSLTSWENSIRDPQKCQTEVLDSLLDEYVKTEYGRRFGATGVQCVEDYRKSFPRVTYADIRPYLEEVRKGNYGVFLSEEPSIWVLTRGSTGQSKVFPVTRRHLAEIFDCGSRAVMNHALKSGGFDMLEGGVLNLNFPSNVETLDVAGKRMVYGYSSGTYARLNPMLRGLALIPRQEEIDALQTGLTPK
ncbi:MAG: GH3 auxin-responsive promoter family protein, partial [Aigarchaeota archaeon]|nr:GH3 auxin-responsive promoter family protein [Aigarchaeota archaeon]